MPFALPSLAGTCISQFTANFRVVDAELENRSIVEVPLPDNTVLRLWMRKRSKDHSIQLDLYGSQQSEAQFFAEISTEELTPLLEKLVGLKAVGSSTATCRVDRTSMPPRGLVNSTLGISTRIKGCDLRLTGATMSVNGLPPVEDISWRHVSQDKLALTISCDIQSTITESFLADLIKHSESGLDKFIFEKADHGGNEI